MLGIEFGLENWQLIILCFCIIGVCAFEFINGFHDTANAVATVIYTNSLKPLTAVAWSGIWNLLGVLFGGLATAASIWGLLSVDIFIHQALPDSIAMILAVLIAAMAWNLGTWYLGIPCSSSHTLIGSIFGVGLAFALVPEGVGVNAIDNEKLYNTIKALIVSPLIGFISTALLITLLRYLFTPKSNLFKAPHGKDKPPLLIQALLILSCTGVSFAHGSNDGQKGIGLMMLLLMVFAPLHFALNPNVFSIDGLNKQLSEIELIIHKTTNAGDAPKRLEKVKDAIDDIKKVVATYDHSKPQQALILRKNLLKLDKKMKDAETIALFSDHADVLSFHKKRLSITDFTIFAPNWVIIVISICLGLGTTVGWKRIVITIGEKIGKSNMTYAQGASAEIVTAITIWAHSQFGLPVSTTQILSSGVAGAMFANDGGLKNLQRKTVTSILLAWFLTLPVTILLSGALYLLIRMIL